MNKVYIGIGSNLGNREENIRLALFILDKNEAVSIVECSSLYETKPYGVTSQNNFYNCVIKIETEFLPEELLRYVKKVEQLTGRKKTFRWGPRVIDLDILYFNELVYKSDKLRIPHPDLLNRDFFIVPLLELQENIGFPGTAKKLVDMVPTTIPTNIVTKMKFNPLV